MAQVLILLGGNIGDVKATFQKALMLLSSKFQTPKRLSSIFISEAWGFLAKERFFNQIIEFDCTQQPIEVLTIIQEAEKQLGRIRNNSAAYQSRPIDIDILFIDNLQISTPELTIPHPLLHIRRFTMEPLMEHWAEKIHPGLNKSIKQLYDQCPDQSVVLKDEASIPLY